MSLQQPHGVRGRGAEEIPARDRAQGGPGRISQPDQLPVELRDILPGQPRR